jgi:hypothetical protein
MTTEWQSSSRVVPRKRWREEREAGLRGLHDTSMLVSNCNDATCCSTNDIWIAKGGTVTGSDEMTARRRNLSSELLDGNKEGYESISIDPMTRPMMMADGKELVLIAIHLSSCRKVALIGRQ